MTLLAGIICPDGIVVASDSQTTWETGKQWNASKMTELKLPTGRALVAESGAETTSASVLEELSTLTGNKSLFEEHTLRGLVEQAVRKTRDKIHAQQFNCTSEELQEHIYREKLDCALMIAHYPEGVPRIDTIKLNLGITNRARSYFETIGTGADLANYLLTDLCTPEMDCATAAVIAVHIVEVVKRHDPYCGGPTKLGILRLPGKTPVGELGGFSGVGSGKKAAASFYPPLLLSRSDIDEIVEMVADVESATRAKRVEIIRDAMKNRAEKRMQEFMDSSEEDEPTGHEGTFDNPLEMD